MNELENKVKTLNRSYKIYDNNDFFLHQIKFYQTYKSILNKY
jgi:hypothetical protein